MNKQLPEVLRRTGFCCGGIEISIFNFNTYATFLCPAPPFSQPNANFKNELFVFLQFWKLTALTAATLSMVSHRRFVQFATPLGYFALGAAGDFNASRLELIFFFRHFGAFAIPLVRNRHLHLVPVGLWGQTSVNRCL